MNVVDNEDFLSQFHQNEGRLHSIHSRPICLKFGGAHSTLQYYCYSRLVRLEGGGELMGGEGAFYLENFPFI